MHKTAMDTAVCTQVYSALYLNSHFTAALYASSRFFSFLVLHSVETALVKIAANISSPAKNRLLYLTNQGYFPIIFIFTINLIIRHIIHRILDYVNIFMKIF